MAPLTSWIYKRMVPWPHEYTKGSSLGSHTHTTLPNPAGMRMKPLVAVLLLLRSPHQIWSWLLFIMMLLHLLMVPVMHCWRCSNHSWPCQHNLICTYHLKSCLPNHWIHPSLVSFLLHSASHLQLYISFLRHLHLSTLCFSLCESLMHLLPGLCLDGPFSLHQLDLYSCNLHNFPGLLP